MEKYAIIVAGGSGLRMNTDLPKQFLLLKNKPILMHTIEAFWKYGNHIQIILCLPEDHIEFWKSLCKKHQFNIPHKITKGGKTRFDSVKNGISLVEKEGLIAIHDGVRPLVSQTTIEKCFKVAKLNGNAIPVMVISESIRKVNENNNVSVNRDQYRLIQTPQVFRSDIIKKAYRQDYKAHFTDDASLLDEMEISLNLVEGNRENIKITTQTDLVFAEALLS